MALKENYKDDILDVSQNVKRKYQMENNGDGTVSFTDVTEYTQQGDSFGASDMNATNGKVNDLESDIGEINDNLSGFKFYPTGTNLVALISDDSFYTDSDDKYVLWGTATANALVEASPNTYYGRPSEEETHGEVGADTCSPFSSGGVKEIASAIVYSANSIYYYVYQIINEKDDTIQSYTHGQNTAGQLEGEYIKINRYTSNPALVFKAKKLGKYRVYKLDASLGSGSYTFIEEKTCNVDDTIVSQNTWGWGGSAKPQFIVKAM